MGKWSWVDDPTAPVTQEPSPTVVTVTASPVVVTTTAKVTVTESPSPTEIRTTITATVTQSPTPTPSPSQSPIPTKTVYRTKTPKPVSNPAVIPPAAESTRRLPLDDELTMPDGKVSLTPMPVSSQPQIVVQVPQTQPVANEGPGPMEWAILVLAAVVVLALLPTIKKRLGGTS